MKPPRYEWRGVRPIPGNYFERCGDGAALALEAAHADAIIRDNVILPLAPPPPKK